MARISAAVRICSDFSLICVLCSNAEEPLKRPALVRHSISRAPPLSLEASDAASEMQDPGHKPGQQAEWWQNRRASTSVPQRKMQRSASSRRLQPPRPEARLQRSKTGLKLNHQVGGARPSVHSFTCTCSALKCSKLRICALTGQPMCDRLAVPISMMLASEHCHPLFVGCGSGENTCLTEVLSRS